MMILLLALPALSLVEGPQDNWTPLFNGKDLDGWVQRGGAVPLSSAPASSAG